MNNKEKVVMTTSSGNPIDNNQNSMTAGPQGPILLQDFTLIDKLAHFDRERIPERVVHAKGAGAHGVFEVTNDVTEFTKANFLNTVGKKTPVFLRFSTVAGESGAPDTQRDPRGFAIKFYTEEGNYDMVGNNTPVFFINDPIKFPDFIHSQKRNPATNLTDPNTIFDFWQHSPEALHQITILFSDRGTPYGYRHMNGYSSHTFKWVNKAGKVHYVKYHFKTDQGIKNFTADEQDKMTIKQKDFSTKDLYDEIQKGNYPSWKFYVQLMPEEDAKDYRFDVFDITKIWPHSDYPLQMVGNLTLNRNPTNYFAEVEQSAFSPSHLVPGIEPSADKMLQGRLFSYPDTHRHRLGKNYDQIPINCPYRARVKTYTRDGVSTVHGNNGGDVNYEPNSVNGPVEDAQYTWSQATLEGKCGRFKIGHKNTPYEQPRDLWNKVFTDQDRTNFVSNISGPLSGARPEIQQGMLRLFWRIDPDYGTRIAKAIGCDLPAECKLEDGQKVGENQNKEAKAASHMAVGVDQAKVQAGNQVDKATATVGWVGCGTMGKHQVLHLMKAGYKVFVWNRTKAKADEAIAAGATWCESAADLAKACNYIIMMVGAPKDVEQMAFCPMTGLFSGFQENTFLIDHTSSSPALAKRMASELMEQKKVTVIDAPVSGGDVGAKAGNLVVMAGGEETALHHVKPLMETYSQNVMYMGAAGQGQHTKMANQIMIGSTMVGLCEALIYGHSAGLPLDNMIELLQNGAAGSHALKNLGPRILKRDMEPGFAVFHFVKDLGIALDESRNMGLSLPGTALASQLYMSFKAQGGENMGTQGLILALEKMNNMSVKKY